MSLFESLIYSELMQLPQVRSGGAWVRGEKGLWGGGGGGKCG